ncbi:MAG: ribonuclease H [Proteobacteria bacterium]|nr:ribonuclease H [Pseudomonadota bacterium]MBU1686632.1 ribonuclease H [Pseudomonadota bacterium]
MSDIVLFVDGSVDPLFQIGMGAYLVLPITYLETPLSCIKKTELQARVRVQRFMNTSSTHLEIQSVLWALEEIQNELSDLELSKIVLVSDSQAVTGLLARRPGLEAENFLTKKKHQPLQYAALYRNFYKLHDRLGFEVFKVKGHSNVSVKDSLQLIFSVVDREARRSLKKWRAVKYPLSQKTGVSQAHE